MSLDQPIRAKFKLYQLYCYIIWRKFPSNLFNPLRPATAVHWCHIVTSRWRSVFNSTLTWPWSAPLHTHLLHLGLTSIPDFSFLLVSWFLLHLCLYFFFVSFSMNIFFLYGLKTSGDAIGAVNITFLFVLCHLQVLTHFSFNPCFYFFLSWLFTHLQVYKWFYRSFRYMGTEQ